MEQESKSGNQNASSNAESGTADNVSDTTPASGDTTSTGTGENGSDTEFAELVEKHTSSPIRSNGKFNIQNVRYLLTYKGHIPKEKCASLMAEIVHLRTEGNFKRVESARETGKTGYKHTHIYLDCGTMLKSRDARVFDIKNEGFDGVPEGEKTIHPNIQIVTTKAHQKNVLKYLAKQDPTNENLRGEIEKEDVPKKKCADIWGRAPITETEHIYNNNVTRIDRASDVETILKHKAMEQTQESIIKELRPWQRELVEELKGEVNRRKVPWYYDPEGGAGKSELTTYIEQNYKGVISCVATGGEKDILYTIGKSIIESGMHPRVIILDLTRRAEVREIYSPIEMMKNGKIYSVKYEGMMIKIKHPHVVVFSNFLPNISQLSKDRWDIRKLEPIYREGEMVDHKVIKVPVEKIGAHRVLQGQCPECRCADCHEYRRQHNMG